MSKLFVVLFALFVTCAREPQEETVVPGPVELRSADQMQDFLSSGRFSMVGSAEARDSNWWEFRADKTFEATLDGQKLTGKWTATKTELKLTGLSGATAERSLPLRWLDGKLNIEIDGVQYRLY